MVSQFASLTSEEIIRTNFFVLYIIFTVSVFAKTIIHLSVGG